MYEPTEVGDQLFSDLQKQEFIRVDQVAEVLHHWLTATAFNGFNAYALRNPQEIFAAMAVLRVELVSGHERQTSFEREQFAKLGGSVTQYVGKAA